MAPGASETDKQPLDMHSRFQQRDYKNKLLQGAYREAVSLYCKDLLIGTQESLNPHKPTV